MEIHTFFPIKGPQRTDLVCEPVGGCGTTITFSPLSWAIRPPGQDARNQIWKERVSLKPVIKNGCLVKTFCRQALATWALEVVSSCMPLRDPDLSLVMHLLVDSDETPDSGGSEPMAVGLSVPLG